MVDTFNKIERSEIMRAVKSKGNKSTELKLISKFKDKGIVGWRRNYKLFGKPDFTFPKKRVVVFVDGCFWHGHNCRNTIPKDNALFWVDKIKRNSKRDKLVSRTLRNNGWQVIRIWECELKKGGLREKLKALLV